MDETLNFNLVQGCKTSILRLNCPISIGRVDLEETDENGNENERENEHGNENEKGNGYKCGIGRRSCQLYQSRHLSQAQDRLLIRAI